MPGLMCPRLDHCSCSIEEQLENLEEDEFIIYSSKGNVMNLCKLLFIHGILTSPSTIANYFEGRNRESKEFEMALLYHSDPANAHIFAPAVWESTANKISHSLVRKKRSNTANPRKMWGDHGTFKKVNLREVTHPH